LVNDSQIREDSMRKMIGVIAVATLLVAGAGLAGAVVPSRTTEGCLATNPAQSTCSFKVTHDNASPVAGVGGVGSWVVTVKLGKKVTTVKSPSSGQPHNQSISLPKGATVTAKALTPGSTLIVGHAD